MPRAGVEERVVYLVLRAELRERALFPDVEYVVNVSRKPVRFRQIDVRVVIPSGIEMWVEIDGPNHRGQRNIARDAELARLASEKGATLLHWPLWRVLDEGATPLVEAILRADRHDGHVEHLRTRGDRYRTFDSRYW